MQRFFTALCLAASAAAQTNAPRNLDLFLLIGQSNMAGRGVVEAADRAPLPRIFTFNEKMEWVPAVDPLHFDKPAIAGVGIGRSFAAVLTKAWPEANIGLIPAAFGGSALNEWASDGTHYPNALRRAREAMKSGRLRGILWHQGEADAGKEELARTYRERFAKLVSRLRADLDAPDVPVVVGQLGPFFQAPFAATVNEQLAMVPLLVPRTAFVPSDGLAHKGDNVHFDTPSLHEFGRRYGYVFLSLTRDSQAQEKKDEVPPDTLAYRAASAITDPGKKIEALEKFKRDFPASDALDSADDAILSTLLKKLPQQTERIRKQAKAIYAAAKPSQKGATATGIAADFLDAGVLLEEAEAYARKGVKALHEEKYAADLRALYARSKAKPPTGEQLHRQFLEARASRIGTLGRLYVKRGVRAAEGKKLLEEAYAVTPAGTGVAETLGLLAVQAGDDAKALDYLTVARLSGRASKDGVAAFDSLYRKQHGGSLEGLEAMLDAEYARRFPNPVKVVRYQPGAARSGRLVLAEVFTGSGCSPCAGADVAFDAALERYSRAELAVVMYHQHIPRPDPMVNPDSVARAKTYGVNSVPSYMIDGKRNGGGGTRAMALEAYERFNPAIEKGLETAAQAGVKLEASASAGAVTVHAAVDKVDTEAEKLTLIVVLVEKEIRYTGENSIRFHPMVARALAAFPVNRGKPAEITHKFDLEAASAAARRNLDDVEEKGHRGESYRFSVKKDRIDPGDLAVVAFVQDPESRNVLQAAWIDLSPKAAKPATE